MTINLDQYTNTLSVTDTATNADLTLVTKGTGVMKFNNGGGEAFRTLDAGTTSGSAYWTIKGSSGGFPFIGVDGTNPNITATFTAKGTSGIQLVTNNGGVLQALVSHTASAVNYVQVTGAATGGQPVISTQGSDANISLRLQAKGDSTVFAVTNSVVAFDAYAPAGSANWLRLRGNTTGIGGALEAFGSDANVDVILSAKGTGAVRSYTNGNQQFAVANTASAVNYVQVTGAATGGSPSISIQGSDANVGLDFIAKGSNGFGFTNSATAGAFGIELASNTSVDKITFIDFHSSAGTDFDFRLARQSGFNNFITYVNAGTGGHAFQTAGGTEQMRVLHTASTVNYLQATGAATGASPVLSAQGSDTNIDVTFTPKGTGNVRFGTYTGTILTPTGYVEIKDSGGTVRRLLVG